LTTTKFSVIITTYIDEKTAFFKEALLSIIKQSVVPSEIVIVYDGPIKESQKDFVKECINIYSYISFNIISLHINVGRGEARNIGIKNASYDLVAIMDSDDISKFDRFEKQLNIFKNDTFDLVASWQEEFTEDSDTIYIKTCPERNSEIKQSLKFRCLIPNPSIMFKKNIFQKVGGYGSNKLLGEDHLLFAKMLMANANMYCIQEPLIEVRINTEQRKRRGGINAIKDDYKLRKELYDIKFITLFEFIKS
jgi:glycosyltransferase involved in cell wall biosynthesis